MTRSHSLSRRSGRNVDSLLVALESVSRELCPSRGCWLTPRSQPICVFATLSHCQGAKSFGCEAWRPFLGKLKGPGPPPPSCPHSPPTAPAQEQSQHLASSSSLLPTSRCLSVPWTLRLPGHRGVSFTQGMRGRQCLLFPRKPPHIPPPAAPMAPPHSRSVKGVVPSPGPSQ